MYLLEVLLTILYLSWYLIVMSVQVADSFSTPADLGKFMLLKIHDPS